METIKVLSRQVVFLILMLLVETYTRILCFKIKELLEYIHYHPKDSKPYGTDFGIRIWTNTYYPNSNVKIGIYRTKSRIYLYY